MILLLNVCKTTLSGTNNLDKIKKAFEMRDKFYIHGN